jgi:glycosyltransferase involved in cell wall biosynthesis
MNSATASTNLPRVLFLTSEAPHTGAAGAIVFHRLLRDYPPDHLLVMTNHPPPPLAGRLACRYVQLPLAADRLDRTRLWPWKAILRSLGASSLPSLGAIDRQLQGFTPDVVVTLMQDSWYYDLAARYARHHGLPLVLFVHDLPSGFEPVPGWLASRQRARDAAVYRQAAARLCISRGMADWFLAEYGVPGEVLLPPRGDDTPAQAPENCLNLKTPGRLTLGYAGGLHYGYGEQLLALLPVLRETGTKLEYFGPPPAGVVAPLAAATDVIRFNGYAPTPAEAWRSLLARCDAVLQPYLNPAGPHERQYRTHFPSKLGDCLSLGLPLLITGPDYASGVTWCLQHNGSALAITDPAPAAFRSALEQLRESVELRKNLANRAQAAAPAFAGPPLRAQLRQLLTTTNV